MLTKDRIKYVIKLIPSYCVEIAAMLVLTPIAKKKYGEMNIWLISERGDEARDNGMHIFKYVRRNFPEQNAFYVIDKDAVDLKNIIGYGNILFRGTMKHRLYFYASSVLISTHLMGGFTTNESFYSHFKRFNYFHKGRKLVSIKHGITKDDLPALYSENSKLDLLIAGAKPEYDYMLDHFHYNSNSLRYTGFARFDNLHHNEFKNQILIMPTWRTYLSSCSKSDFINTDFYRYWNSLLKNERLIEFIKEKGYKLVFYPHYEIQKYLSCFNLDDDSVVVADSNHFDIQALLKESRLLVTDYSSVYFDFAYMQKPTLYFQFDMEQYRRKHYRQGYYDYETMGFGPLLKTEDDVINAIIESFSNEFVVEEKYLKRINDFFPLRDTNNCNRIYQAIVDVAK